MSGVPKSLCVAVIEAAIVLCGSSSGAWGGDGLPASDWITTGPDCRVFAAGDVNGDGFPDLLTINGNRDLCIAASVNGWKAANWRVLAGDVSPDAVGLVVWEGTGEPAGVRVVVVEEGRVVVVPIGADGTTGERVVNEAKEGQKFNGIVRYAVPRILDASGATWSIDKDGNLVNGWGASLRELRPSAWTLSKPPYDAGASEVCSFESGVSATSGRMGWTVFASELPHAHRVVRTR